MWCHRGTRASTSCLGAESWRTCCANPDLLVHPQGRREQEEVRAVAFCLTAQGAFFVLGLSCNSDGKESACNTGDLGSLGRCGKGSRLPDFSAGPLNGPKHPQDTVSSLSFPGCQVCPAPMHPPPCVDPALGSMEPGVGREPTLLHLLSSFQHPLQGCSDPGHPRSSA